MSLDGLDQVAARSGSTLPGDGETHLWAYGLDLEAPVLGGLESLLSRDEIARANRFRAPRDRVRFVAGRGQLRQILGDYVGRPPELLRFDYSPEGKPSLAGDTGPVQLRFNAAGSEALGVVAVRTDGEVGADIEYARPLADGPALARRLLQADEFKEFAALPEALRHARLFDYWVRKEAIAKTLGSGLREGLDRLSLHPWPSDGQHRIEGIRAGEPTTAWVVRVPVPLAGYAAALAATLPFGPVISKWWEPRLSG